VLNLIILNCVVLLPFRSKLVLRRLLFCEFDHNQALSNPVQFVFKHDHTLKINLTEKGSGVRISLQRVQANMESLSQ